jgi:4'-phosphopantetheinyl transferase
MLNSQIDIWKLDIKAVDQKLINDVSKKILPEELNACKRFITEDLQKLQILTRYGARSVLSYYEPTVKPLEWIFKKGEYDKPFFTNHTKKNLQFNIAHSHNLIIIGISQDSEIGVDIEKIRPLKRMDSIAATCFSTHELHKLRTCKGQAYLEYFYSIWALKEAYIKATGLGLNANLQSFNFDITNTITLTETDYERKNHRWKIHLQSIENEYKMGVAVRDTAPTSPLKFKIKNGFPGINYDAQAF